MSLLLLRSKKYYKKILKYGPLTLWPQWELSGNVAQCLTGPAMNGQYTGVTLGQRVTDSKGVTFICPFYDGANDYTNVWTTAFRDAFNGLEGTMIGWAKVNGGGVWTDAAERVLFQIWVDGNNYVRWKKTVVNNTLAGEYHAGAVTKDINISFSGTDWFSFGSTWSASADEVRHFLIGIQQGATLTNLGVWAGDILNVATLIGAANTGPASVWHGWSVYAFVLPYAATPIQVKDLVTL